MRLILKQTALYEDPQTAPPSIRGRRIGQPLVRVTATVLDETELISWNDTWYLTLPTWERIKKDHTLRRQVTETQRYQDWKKQFAEKLDE